MNTFIADKAERSRPYLVIGVAAVLAAAVAVGAVLALTANRPQPTGSLAVGATTSPTAPAPSPSAAPTAAAAPAPGSEAAPFICGASTITASKSPMTAFVDAMRTGSHPGYDRLTVEFENGQPATVLIRPQPGTTFNQAPSGQPMTLAGSSGILVIIRGADAHTAYTGLRDIKTKFAGLVEVRVLEDFEGQVSLGLGLTQAACYRATFLANPVRLVIDTQVG